MTTQGHPLPPQFRPIALLAGCAVPGLGHIVGGETRRGVLIASGILGLFFGGILIGGIDVIDSREDRAWFIGQALVGPIAFGVDYYHQNHLKVMDPVTRQLRSAYPGEGRDEKGVSKPGGTPPNVKSVGKMNEIGTLYATIAGMLNVIAVVDAGFWSRRKHAAEKGKA